MEIRAKLLTLPSLSVVAFQDTYAILTINFRHTKRWIFLWERVSIQDANSFGEHVENWCASNRRLAVDFGNGTVVDMWHRLLISVCVQHTRVYTRKGNSFFTCRQRLQKAWMTGNFFGPLGGRSRGFRTNYCKYTRKATIQKIQKLYMICVRVLRASKTSKSHVHFTNITLLDLSKLNGVRGGREIIKNQYNSSKNHLHTANCVFYCFVKS